MPTVFECVKCGRYLSPVDAVLNPVCRDCVNKAHRNVVRGSR